MGNMCCKGYSPKKNKESEISKEISQNGEAVKADIEITRNAHSDSSQRQASQLSNASTLSNEEVSVFFTSPEEYEIRQRRKSIDTGSNNISKSRDDLNSNDIRLDISGISNPAFTSDNEEVLDLTLRTPEKSQSPESVQANTQLSRVPDSFELSKYVINTNDTTNVSNDNDNRDNKDRIPRSMSSEEVIDLIDNLLQANPRQSSTDDRNNTTNGVKFSLGSSISTSQDKETASDTFKSTNPKGKLTRMAHVYELAEETDITLRNEVLLETGHKGHTLVKQDTDKSSASKYSPTANGRALSNGITNAAYVPSIYSGNSIGTDEDELWTGIEMTEQNLLSRIEAGEITNDDEIVDALEDISRQRQRMLNLRGTVPYKEDTQLPTDLNRDILVEKLEVERNYSEKLEDLNQNVATTLLNAQKNSIDMASLQAIIEDHRRRQNVLHSQLLAEKARVDRHLAEKLKAKNKSSADDFDESGSETNIENILGMSMDEIRRNPNKESSIETDSPADFDGRFSRIADHCGVVLHDSDFDDNETDDLILTAYEELLDHTSEEEVVSSENSPKARNFNTKEDVTTSAALRSTLKTDVKSHMNDMTVSDFQELLNVFRQEETEQKQTKSRSKESRLSLWKTMEDRRQDGQTAQDKKVSVKDKNSPVNNIGVGQSSPTKVDAATEVGKSMLMKDNNDVAVQATEVSNVNKDLQSIQKKFLQEAEDLDNDLINTLHQKQKSVTQEELMKILNSHFDSVENLRKVRKNESDKIQSKLEEKLRSRMKKIPSESSDDDGIDDVIKSNSQVGSNAETEYKFHKKEMTKTDKAIVDNETKIRQEMKRKANDLSVDDVKQVLADYRKQQKDLIKKRDMRRKLMNDKLLAVLEERRLKAQASQDSNPPEQEAGVSKEQEQEAGVSKEQEQEAVVSKEQERGSSRRKNVLDKDVEEMDADFYKDLMDRYGKSSLTEAELEKLLEEHLNKVDDLKKKVKRALSKKRKERTAEEKEKRRRRRQAKKNQEEENAKHANELVQQKDEQAKQMRQLRERERKRASILLREKLAKKQHKRGEPLIDLKIAS